MDGPAIRRLRTAAGLTQEEFGKRVGVSRRSVTDWEANKTQPSRSMLERIKEADFTPAAPQARRFAPGKILDVTTHPQCFIVIGERHHRTLAHPHWFLDVACILWPRLYASIPETERRNTRVEEYETHKPLTPETVWEIFRFHGVPEREAILWMQIRGHTQFGQVEVPAESLSTGFGAAIEASGGKATADELRAAGIQLNYALPTPNSEK